MSDYKLYLKEIISMIEKIENSIIGKSLEDFVDIEKTDNYNTFSSVFSNG